MGVLSKMMNAISGQPESDPAVRQALDAARQGRARLALEIRSGGKPVVMVSTIEQIRDNDLVISQPSVGGMTHQLAFGEPLKLSFAVGTTYQSGASRCLGRVKIPSGHAGGTLFAYSIAMPERLDTEDRRNAPRVRMGPRREPEAQLYSPALKGLVLGKIVDLSMTGALIRTQFPPGKIAAGQHLFLKTSLDEPVGLVDEEVTVIRVINEAGSGHLAIGVQFNRRIEGLEELLRNIE